MSASTSTQELGLIEAIFDQSDLTYHRGILTRNWNVTEAETAESRT